MWKLCNLSPLSPCPSSVRLLSTTPRVSKFLSKWIVPPGDLYKKPSQDEIARKELPYNTPNLKQRIERDHDARFYELSKRGGYYSGKTGTVRRRLH